MTYFRVRLPRELGKPVFNAEPSKSLANIFEFLIWIVFIFANTGEVKFLSPPNSAAFISRFKN